MYYSGAKSIVSNQIDVSDRIKAHEEWLKDPSKGARLSATGVNFVGLTFSGTLRKAEFTDCSFLACTFENIHLDGIKAKECDFRHATFRATQAVNDVSEFSNCDFSNTEFSTCLFNRTLFAMCNFLDTNQVATNFSECRFNGGDLFQSVFGGQLEKVSFTGVRISKTTFATLFDCGFSENCTLLDMDFSAIPQLRRTGITGSTLTDCVFDNLEFGSARDRNISVFSNNTCSRSWFRSADFKGCEIAGSMFSSSNLGGATLHLFGMDIRNAVFAAAIMPNVTFKHAAGAGIGFFSADLARAKFIDCALPLGQFSGATLEAAEFLRCDLRGASFLDAIFPENAPPSYPASDLDGASWYEGSVCRPGSVGFCNRP